MKGPSGPRFAGPKGVAYSSKSSEWETPKAAFDELDHEFQFTRDVCATKKNTKCRDYFNKKEDGLIQEWAGSCWMNPPYGREIGKWVKKAYEAAQTGKATVVCLLPARTDTQWWHAYCMKGEVRFLQGRLCFTRPDGTTGRAPFPSAVVVFRCRNES